jgi:hypothetical protein
VRVLASIDELGSLKEAVARTLVGFGFDSVLEVTSSLAAL